MKHVYSLLFIVSGLIAVSGQCDDYLVNGSQVFHANEVRTVIHTGGDMFWDHDNGAFQVPYKGPESPNAMYSASVWLGGYDDQGNLRLSAQKFRLNRLEYQEYQPGPLVAPGVPFSTDCAQWDIIWSVTSHEVQLHIQDYEDNGVIDNPQRSIFGWPGLGNAAFETINGFAMPHEPQGYAPFYDKNENGFYEPEQGEYPLPFGLPALAIPERVTWHVFHDAGAHNVSSGEMIGAEFQQTTYAFYCSENSVINRTIFVDFHIVNRSMTGLDSTVFALWTIPQLGCYTDDYMGSAPEHDAYMVYNQKAFDGSIDGRCLNNVRTYGQRPPVHSGRFINREMSAFIYHYGGPPSLGPLNAPENDPQEYYRFMRGTWRDGSPLTTGGNGYGSPGGEVTTFAFPGNPNDVQAWSMRSVGLNALGLQTVASTHIGSFLPGQGVRITMAFALHQDPDNDYLENVTLMYNELPQIKEQHVSGFASCGIPTEACLEDCVWAGDANHDGIVNHLDLLDLGIANGTTGPARNAPLSWAPFQADPWSNTVTSGANAKHADTNADGVVDIDQEMEIMRLHYGQTRVGYTSEITFVEGHELIVDGGFSMQNPSWFMTQTVVSLNPALIDELYGVAFTIIYDSQYFSQTVVDAWTPFGTAVSRKWMHQNPGQVEYAMVKIDGQNAEIVKKEGLIRLYFTLRPEGLTPGQHDTTFVRIANIHGILNDGTEVVLGAQNARFVFLDESVTSVENPEANERIFTYPNPSIGEILIGWSGDLDGARYVVYSLAGVPVTTGILQDNSLTMSLPAGIFALVVHTDRGTLVERIVVLER